MAGQKSDLRKRAALVNQSGILVSMVGIVYCGLFWVDGPRLRDFLGISLVGLHPVPPATLLPLLSFILAIVGFHLRKSRMVLAALAGLYLFSAFWVFSIGLGFAVFALILTLHWFWARALQHEAKLALPFLTQREQQIMELVARGKRNKEIASMLWISENTVESHLRNVYAKLKCRNRSEAIRAWGKVNGNP